MKEENNQARWVAILALTGIAVYLCWLMLRPFISVLEWAAVLVIVFYPVHRRLANKIGRRGLSAFASSLLVIVVLGVPLTFLTVTLANELAGAARSLPSHVGQLLKTDAGLVGRVPTWLRQVVDAESSQAFIDEQLRSLGTALLGQSMSMVGNLLSAIAKAFFVIITMYYLFRDGDKFAQLLPEILPFERSESEAMIKRVTEVVSAGVYGVVMIATIQGCLGGLAFWILGVPSPVLWAVLMTLICMIPIFGSYFVWLPASIYLILTGHWTKAIFLIIWGALVISTVDNFLRPKLIKNKTKLHELFILFSVLGGIKVFGLLGIILGPVVLAITLALIETLSQKNREVVERVRAVPAALQPDVSDHRTAA